MDDRKDIHRAGRRAGRYADLQPALEPAAGASDVVGLPVVDRPEKDSVSSGRWFELLLFGRIGSEGVAELG